MPLNPGRNDLRWRQYWGEVIMVSDHRESYTPDGVKAMKWGLAREAIGRDIEQVFSDASRTCIRGSLDEGFRVSFDHSEIMHDRDNEPGYLPPESVTHHCLPPVPSAPGKGDGTVYLEDYKGNRTPSGSDVWGDSAGSNSFDPQGFYAKWVGRVDRTFTGWDKVDEIPDERNFAAAARHLRDLIKPLESVALPVETYYTACRTLGLIEHDPGAMGTTPPKRMWAPQINGPIDRFVVPLQGTLLNLHVLGELLAAQLDGMGKMWHNARASVMDIGWHGTEFMSGQKSFDPEVILKSAGWVGGAMGLVTMPATVAIGVAAGGLVLSAAQELLGAINDKDVVDRAAEIGGGTAQEVLNSIQSVLNVDQISGLEPQIQIDESDVIDVLKVALDRLQTDNATYNPDTKRYETYFTIEVSDVLTDTHPGSGIEVDFQRLRDAGKTLADELKGELELITRGVQEIFPSNSVWKRPEVPNSAEGIGIGHFGPWDEWNNVRNEMVRVLDTTATQVEDMGEYLIGAANFLERQDQTAKAAFEQISRQLGDDF